MKQCPQCRNSYTDDNLFCLEDGTELEFARSFTGQKFFSGDAPTVVIPKYPAPAASQIVPNQSQNKWTYPIIGVLAGLVVVLGFLAFYKLNSNDRTAETATVKESANRETPAPTPFQTPGQMPTPLPPAPRPQANPGTLAGRFPEGSTRLLTSADLYGKTNGDLRIMRNEIFARYGYVFKNAQLRNYFLNQPWYRPQFDNVENFLSEMEKRNVIFLKSYE